MIKNSIFANLIMMKLVEHFKHLG